MAEGLKDEGDAPTFRAKSQNDASNYRESELLTTIDATAGVVHTPDTSTMSEQDPKLRTAPTHPFDVVRPTARMKKVSVALPDGDSKVLLDDVPVLLDDELPPFQMEDEDMLRLVAAVDGRANVLELAERAGIDFDRARAYLARLGDEGLVTFESHDRPKAE